MSPMDATDFEARYRSSPDPWGYHTSEYERNKYAATLAACGEGPFSSALELGASIGVFSSLLAPRCRALTTIDFAPTAVAMARKRLAAETHVDVRLGALPEDFPAGAYDLVVASEILYYLPLEALHTTLTELEAAMLPHARMVAVHWRPAGPDRWLDATAVHSALQAQSWLAPVNASGTDQYRLDLLERA
jgi:protein-L-isoaspartate O-methyltransferase